MSLVLVARFLLLFVVFQYYKEIFNAASFFVPEHFPLVVSRRAIGLFFFIHCRSFRSLSSPGRDPRCSKFNIEPSPDGPFGVCNSIGRFACSQVTNAEDAKIEKERARELEVAD